MSASGVEGDEFYDAVDWKSILEKKEKELSSQKSRINHLERKQEQRVDHLKQDLYDRDSKYEALKEESVRMRKRLQWMERKEEEERQRLRLKRRKREREHEIQEEVKIRVRIEEEEHQRIREEMEQKKN